MPTQELSIVRAAALALATLGATACNNAPTEGKSSAAVSDPGAVVEAPAQKLGTTYAFDNTNSKVAWVGAKVTRKHDGSFQKFSGSIDLVEKDPLKSSVHVDIDMASVTTDEGQLTTHLKKPDLLDVEKFPKARFASTSITAGGDKDATHTVSGNFELHGITKKVSFPATIAVSDAGVDVKAEFGINRKDFGIVYPGMPDDLISDDVLIKLDIHSKP